MNLAEIRERHDRDDNYIRSTFDDRVLEAHEDRIALLKFIDEHLIAWTSAIQEALGHKHATPQ